MDLNPTRIPFLNFNITNPNDKIFSLVSSSGHSKMPSWVTSFSYVRKAPSLGAGVWSLSLSDPTFTLMDIMQSIFSGEDVTEDDVVNFASGRFSSGQPSSIPPSSGINPLGEVSFKYGHTTASGVGGFQSEYIKGYITKITPSIVSKHKLSVHMQGFDASLELWKNSAQVSLDMFGGAGPRTLKEELIAVVANINEFNPDTILNVEFNFTSPELENLMVVHEDINSTDSVTTLSRFINSRGSMSFVQYCRYLEEQLSQHRIRFQFGATSNSNATTVTVKTENRTGGVFVNTTSEDFVLVGGLLTTQVNDSRVISFDPTIEPLVPAMLGANRMIARLTDAETLETETVTVDLNDNEETNIIGDGVLSDSTVGEVVAPESISQLNRDGAEKKMKYLQGWLSRIPFRASLRFQYIDVAREPYDFISVFVATPQGKAFFTSGLYLITEISDNITPGRFLTTYQMIKSGNQSLNTIVPALGSKDSDDE